MWYSKILPGSSGSAQASPEGNSVRESLIKGSKKESPKPFSGGDQPRRNSILLAPGFSMTFLAVALLVVCLWAFSTKGPLDKWERRSFNTLSIMLTAIASLGLGSLLGHLGSMLRWPLLARTVYQMQDVDSILGMSPPAGSLRLIKRHVQEWRISRTTFIVTAYLVTNVIGRLSVAIFGLAYNMTDKTGIEYPILATNWSSALWTGQIFSNVTADAERGEYESGEALMNSAWNGLLEYAEPPHWAYGEDTSFSIGDDINSYLSSDLLVSNTTLNLSGNTVEYSYRLKDFKEGYAIPSNHTVRSGVNCRLIEIVDGQYWRWGNGNRTGPFSWSEKNNNEVVSEILQVLNRTRTRDPLLDDILWMSFLDGRGGSSIYPQIYILCENIAWECWPTLTETIAGKESRQIQTHEEFFQPTDLYRLLTVGDGYYTDSSDERYIYLGCTGGSQSGARAGDGLELLCGEEFFEYQNKTVWNGYRLWVAGLVARLPILAIMHANTALHKFARGPYPNRTAGTAYLHTTLEVNWRRVVLIAISITGGQILAILAVLSYCDGVYTRDDSHLAAAELLKTVITRFDDGKLMTGEELAVSLDDVLEAPVRYGTRKGQDGGQLEVDLASGLDANLLPFPRKRRFWRNTS